ncbi:unnamed protein product [Meganyctiphanes norvegica]|uniref:Uncharacterized protein n=1 Tax=Meganyctiphanes norvegica TaxID=48144 RepID=A0AAV2RAS6_MEGNR
MLNIMDIDRASPVATEETPNTLVMQYSVESVNSQLSNIATSEASAFPADVGEPPPYSLTPDIVTPSLVDTQFSYTVEVTDAFSPPMSPMSLDAISSSVQEDTITSLSSHTVLTRLVSVSGSEEVPPPSPRSPSYRAPPPSYKECTKLDIPPPTYESLFEEQVPQKKSNGFFARLKMKALKPLGIITVGIVVSMLLFIGVPVGWFMMHCSIAYNRRGCNHEPPSYIGY